MTPAPLRSPSEANGFDVEALPANRRGELTPTQQRLVRGRRRAWSAALLVFALLLIVCASQDLLFGQHDPAAGRSDALLALLLGGALLALRFTRVGRSHAATIAAGKVSSVDGFVRVGSSSGDGHTAWHYRIDDHEFDTTEDGAKAIDARSRYRVYYLPGTDIMVNVEALDRVFADAAARGVPLAAEEVAAIVGEPMREEHASHHVGSDAWPGMVFSAFAGKTTDLHVVIGVMLGANDGPLARCGDLVVSVNLLSITDPAAVCAAERSFDIARRLAALALQKLRPSPRLPISQENHG